MIYLSFHRSANNDYQHSDPNSRLVEHFSFFKIETLEHQKRLKFHR
uniref:Uncharacterized protein n=1 Tax=Rhizophora mucronata TaxID=61149 RepID=A0A2P2NNS0_RHIMU